MPRSEARANSQGTDRLVVAGFEHDRVPVKRPYPSRKLHPTQQINRNLRLGNFLIS
jgi:hypothetical protein